MKKYTYTDGGRLFVRITKTTARKAYNNGLRIVLCPSNLRPGFPYHPEISISGKAAASFEEAVDRFTGEKPTAETLGTVQEYDYSYIGQ